LLRVLLAEFHGLQIAGRRAENDAKLLIGNQAIDFARAAPTAGSSSISARIGAARRLPFVLRFG
jgi:hypothetical protein